MILDPSLTTSLDFAKMVRIPYGLISLNQKNQHIVSDSILYGDTSDQFEWLSREISKFLEISNFVRAISEFLERWNSLKQALWRTLQVLYGKHLQKNKLMYDVFSINEKKFLKAVYICL